MMADKLGLNILRPTWWSVTFSRIHLRRLSAQQIRSSFLEYFEKRDHTYVPSSSVIPQDDSSVAFVSAGMNQFKPLFLGVKYTDGKLAGLRNVVNWQKCIRIGGKHNDFDDVGRDLTHHTFFEMLGNYSFGGYSKLEACRYAWEFLTDILGIPADRLYVTYFAGDERMKLAEDRQCRDIWIKIGVPEDRVLAFSATHNFWEMAETGPCGPCTEIHYDMTGNRNARELVNSNDPSVVEIWNLVFMQYNRDVSTTVTALPSLYIDCGMGFERLVSVVQGVHSTYDTDLFRPLMETIHKCCKVERYGGRVGAADSSRTDTAYRIIADHLRAACIMISDGVKAGSRNRGYQLRRLLRRAALNLSLTLCAERDALAVLVTDFVKHLSVLYDAVAAFETVITETVLSEEQLFWKSYDKGRKLLHENIISSQTHILPGEIAWMFSNNYGLPLELTQQICANNGLEVDVKGFHQCLSKLQRVQKAKNEPWQKVDLGELLRNGVKPTDDSSKYDYKRVGLGEYEFSSRTGNVVAVFDIDGQPIKMLKAGEPGCVVMDSTVFFAEQGGQLDDRGTLRDSAGNIVFVVNNAKRRNGYVIHTGVVTDDSVATVVTGMALTQFIDPEQRFSLMCGHTAAHILHFVLQKIFRSPVRQMGSRIEPGKLHFDFNFSATSEPFDLRKIEEVTAAVNDIIERDLNVAVKYIAQTEIGSLHSDLSAFDISQEAAPGGLFRIVSIESSEVFGQDIIEPCCGTHVSKTGDIGKFVVIGQKARSAGVRRIYAATSRAAIENIRVAEKLNKELSYVLSSHNEAFIDTNKFLDVFQKAELPVLSKVPLYEMIKAVKKRNKRLSQKLRNSDAVVN